MKDHGNGHRDYGLSGATVATKATRDPVVWNSELDAILREGYARGWSGAREAVDKIQKLRPKWRSHIIWDRAKQLGFQQEYVLERPPWSAADDAALMDFAQEQSVATIARWLHRSAWAVRKRFAVLGESARVRDNYTQLDLARDLRVSPKMVRHWEAAGVLQRRDGRITHESLKQLFRKLWLRNKLRRSRQGNAAVAKRLCGLRSNRCTSDS